MIDRRDALIGVGVAAGAAILVLFLKSKNATPGASAAGSMTGSDINGGFATANTVFVPTTETTVNYNQYKGAVTYDTTTNNTSTTATTTFSNSPGATAGAGVFKGQPIIYHQPPVASPSPVHITTTGSGVTNVPTIQTGKTGYAAAPKHAAPSPVQKSMGNLHYATPKGGWNQASVVDYIKQKGGYSSFADRAGMAKSFGIKNYTGTAQQNSLLLTDLKQKYGNA